MQFSGIVFNATVGADEVTIVCIQLDAARQRTVRLPVTNDPASAVCDAIASGYLLGAKRRATRVSLGHDDSFTVETRMQVLR